MKAIILSLLLAASALAEAPYDSVGRLSPPGKMYGGSCVLIKVAEGRGLLVSNAHVCDSADTFEAHWGTETRVAKTILILPKVDLCFLVVDNPPVAPARLGMRDGHLVLAGYPHYDRAHLHWRLGYYIDGHNWEIVWANMVVGGMSGGAIFDVKDGDLCGLIRATEDGLGYGVSDSTLILSYLNVQDPKTWIPDGSHVGKVKMPGTPAAPSKVVITNVYDPKTAPKLGD